MKATARENASPFVIEVASHRDVPAIAALFVAAFGGHSIAPLAAPLQRRFVAAYVDARLALVAVDRASGTVVGFAIAGHQDALDRARRRYLYRNAPALLAPMLRTRLRSLGDVARVAAVARDRGSRCELRYLAVSDTMRGSGIGSALLIAAEERLLPRESYCVWVLAARAAALRFYFRHGFAETSRVDGHVCLVKHQAGSLSAR